MSREEKSTSTLLYGKSKYNISDKIGSGAYGEVFRGENDDGDAVALKRVIITDDDDYNNIPLSTHRELNVLKRLNSIGNENIVKLFDIVLNRVGGKMCVDMVFELSDCDLESYLSRVNKGGDMPMSKIINLGTQLMDGVHFMHSNRVIHRDLKPANILIDNKGSNLKITDFGLARVLGFDASLTPVAVTLWYRSPEILFQNKYLTSCDVWSVGCIIGEMIFGRPLFAADNEFKQMEKIVSRLGYEAINNWPEDAFFNFTSFAESIDPSRCLDRVLKRADSSLRSLIKALLRFNPDLRITSKDALSKLNELHRVLVDRVNNSCNCHNSSVNKTCSIECKLDSQNRMLVNSVVRNVFDDDSADIQIPGLTDNSSINEYLHEEVEVNGVSDNTDIESCEDYPYESIEIYGVNTLTDIDSSDDRGDGPRSICKVQRECDNARDSFGSYRNQGNESLSSRTTSLTGEDSITDNEVNDPKDLNELREFHEGFAISDSDSDTCYQVAAGSHSLDISESTTTRDGEDTRDLIVSEDSQDYPLSTTSCANLSPFLVKSESQDSFLVNDAVTLKNSVPLTDIRNICKIDLVSPTSPRKASSTRKRIISSDISGESESELENIWSTVCEHKSTISRHKSLRRRLSVVGPHVSSDRKPPCRRNTILPFKSIVENEDIQNQSFGENSLSHALDSAIEHSASPLTGRPKVIVRRRSQWK